MTKTQEHSVKIPGELWLRLKKIADQKYCNVSTVAREAVVVYLNIIKQNEQNRK